MSLYKNKLGLKWLLGTTKGEKVAKEEKENGRKKALEKKKEM